MLARLALSWSPMESKCEGREPTTTDILFTFHLPWCEHFQRGLSKWARLSLNVGSTVL